MMLMSDKSRSKFSETSIEDFYESYFDNGSYTSMLWDVGSYSTRQAIKSKIDKNCGALLTLGCGMGIFLNNMNGFMRVGVDISTNSLRIAKMHASEDVHFVKCDIQKLSFKDSVFDVVTTSHVLEHIPNNQDVIDKVHRTLSRGGEFVAFVPSRLNGESTVAEKESMGHLRMYNENRFKYVLFAINLIVKLIKNDKKSIYERNIYRKYIVCQMVKLLNMLDRLVHKKERTLLNQVIDYNILVKSVKTD